MIERLSQDGERIAVMAVCQPGIPAMAAAALMAMRGNPRRPASLVLMGSPMDTARNPKQPNELAQHRSLAWFENNVVVLVPWPQAGFLRRVYPGFLQLSGFLSMNINRHVDAHMEQFRKLVRGDGDGAEQHRAFYDEYLAVIDLTAEFYLQTIDRVFQRRLLANGAYRHRGTLVETAAIDDIALMTIEGEQDDITGLGQTEAAHDMVPNLPAERRGHYVARGVGHYGVFNGSRWRTLIEPQLRSFILAQRRGH
jgi:poly(3-hydroxybutyrate) depolymerase